MVDGKAPDATGKVVGHKLHLLLEYGLRLLKKRNVFWAAAGRAVGGFESRDDLGPFTDAHGAAHTRAYSGGDSGAVNTAASTPGTWRGRSHGAR